MIANKVALITPQENFRDEELLETKKILESHNFKAVIVSKTRNKILGKLGTELEPDLAAREVDAKDFVGAVFVGGAGAAAYFNDDDILKLARDFKWLGKVISAIDVAPTILANAGCLISKTVTALHTEEQNLKNRGADYTGMSVEVDGKIVTGKDVSAVKEFAEKVAFILKE